MEYVTFVAAEQQRKFKRLKRAGGVEDDDGGVRSMAYTVN